MAEARGTTAGADEAVAAPRARRVAPRKPPAKGKGAAKAKAPPPRERWGIEKELTFLATVVETVNVSASARAAGVSETTIYRQRAKSAEFRGAWAAALREGYARLELMMLERAIKGQEKPVFFGGKEVARITEYSDRTALALLSAHRGSVLGPDAPSVAIETPEEMRARLAERLMEMRRRLTAAGE